MGWAENYRNTEYQKAWITRTTAPSEDGQRENLENGRELPGVPGAVHWDHTFRPTEAFDGKPVYITAQLPVIKDEGAKTVEAPVQPATPVRGRRKRKRRR